MSAVKGLGTAERPWQLEAGRVKTIRDFRYVPYIAAESDFEILAA